MKASALIVAVAFVLSPILSNATIWRVNNNPVLASNCDHCFTDLAEAVANPFVSANGARDTIHLEASPMNYGSVTMAKPIVLIGPGFKLGMGTANNPDLQANNQMATATRITLAAGSDGSVFTGIRFNGPYAGLYINDVENITAIRNFFDSDGLIFDQTPNLPFSGYIVTGNYFNLSGIATGGYSQYVSNVVISNNYFNGAIDLENSFSNVTVANNLFDYNTVQDLWGSIFKNNILRLGSVNINDNDIHHNIAAGATSLPAGNNNVNSIPMTNVFNPAFTSDDTKWKLPSNSPYLTAGDDGLQLGIYGGISPYIPSGIPAIPTIYELTVPAAAIQGGTIEVTLSTRSNN
ncbi:MAG: hypothetical protein LKM36_05775 [Flavobacteriales bacterium]|jgi:hypothetical protein|nr:hypothetical protein [Flavobacteriales bacterium]